MTYRDEVLYRELLSQIGKDERQVLNSLEICFIQEVKIINYVSNLYCKKIENDIKWLCDLVSIDIYLSMKVAEKTNKNRTYYSKLDKKYTKLSVKIPKTFISTRESFFKILNLKESEFPEIFSKEKIAKILEDEFIKIERKLVEHLKAARVTEVINKNYDKVSKRNPKSYYLLTSIFTMGYFANKKLTTKGEIEKLYKKVEGKNKNLCEILVEKFNRNKKRTTNKMPILRDFTQNGLINNLSNPMTSSLIESHGLNFKNRQSIYRLCDFLQKLIEEKKKREFILVILIILTVKYEASLFIDINENQTKYEADDVGIYFYCTKKAEYINIQSRKVYLIKYGTYSIIAKHLDEKIDRFFK